MLKGNYTQAIQGNKKVEITGKLNETSDSYTHFAQTGDIIIQSANISKTRGLYNLRRVIHMLIK
ncbi:hypothetical protein [Capnocytophaga catalasegens]|uniref:Single-stranded DNA-binding protein n=1 Tax=Capnocytophaga catalasegens TaxID=1004260 RepID=A0AAV5AYQ4_9FLAO|nr:hypothetical protein [Capnocytophaga catalasegens]GIZ16196.1 hypothetical protein RCZ03_21960 [Capnocytophaga catalasegens]GJM51630.1 hypothetical protein RCZ15_26030 [Capnocytophaga catalasegens]GJM54264.1 hypothetical protein RCZ16_25800 [Capnocytophaga catalasegens]